MKPNKLMVKDFFYNDHKKPMKASAINGKESVSYKYRDSDSDLKGDISESPTAIQLTEEMLMLNGFVQGIGYPLSYVRLRDDFLSVRVTNQNDGEREYRQVILSNEVIYVHEVQQALRLCGYDEIADEFSIGSCPWADLID